MVTGLMHLGATIFIANSILLKESYVIYNIMDIPFILTGLIYGLASLRLALFRTDQSHKALDIFLGIIIIVALTGLLYINLAIPSR